MASLGGRDVFAILLIGLGKNFFAWNSSVSQLSVERWLASRVALCSHWKPQAVTKWHSWQQRTWLICFECDTQTACQIPFQVFFPPYFVFFLFIPNYSKVLFTRYWVYLQQTQQNGEMYHLASRALVSTGWVQRSKIQLIRLQCTELAVSWHLE